MDLNTEYNVFVPLWLLVIGVSRTPLMAHGSVLWNGLPLEMQQLTSLNARC